MNATFTQFCSGYLKLLSGNRQMLWLGDFKMGKNI